MAAKVRQLFEDSGFASPREDELPDLLGVSPAQIAPVLRMLLTEGSLLRISPKVILSRLHLIDAQGKVVQYIKVHGALESGDFKSVIQASRKYAISILEYLDRLRITLRVGDARKLSTTYETRLLK